MVEFLRTRITGEQIEELGEILTESFPASEQAEVAVNPGGACVVIPCGKMTVAPDAIGFLADHETDLAVGLVADQPVNDMDSRFFKLAFLAAALVRSESLSRSGEPSTEPALSTALPASRSCNAELIWSRDFSHRGS